MPEYLYNRLNAFSSGGSSGNPAACLFPEHLTDLSAEQMQRIAAEHKGLVSEVVFCAPSGTGGYDLSYYSSECEVDFCGHGTIACMYSLIKDTPGLSTVKEIPILTARKGPLTVYNEIEASDAVFISAPSPRYSGTSITATAITSALALALDAISDRLPVDFIDAGLRTLIVPLKNLSEEISCLPDEENLREFCLSQNVDIILIFTTETEDTLNIAHTRVFAPKYGYLEDPATGSGNSALGYYLLKNNLWTGDRVSIEQGPLQGPYNIVKLETRDGRVLFGGRAELTCKGLYRV
jgi:PhzF family phenazine biosynthesis protein